MTNTDHTLPAAKHTPGPWHLVSDQHVYDRHRHLIAKVALKPGNGILIAAAPELLAAIQETTPLLDACARNAERLGQRQFAAQLLTIISANRAALAKANGGEQ
jgi:hypothetical protein